MSCTTCQTKFSFFTKDIGCPSCGFSSCARCLKFKCDLPNIGTKKVCGRCYHKLNKMKRSGSEDVENEAPMPNASSEPLAPIDITMKLDSLENPIKPPIVIYKHTDHWDALKQGLEPVDQQIVERLRNLKEERNTLVPTFDEITQRLALLKDQDPQASGSYAVNIHQVDTRTDQEKTDDLIKEYMAEIKLPSSSELYKEIHTSLKASQYDELVNRYSAMEIETPPNMEDEDENEDEDKDEDEDEDEDKDEDEAEFNNECSICLQTAEELELYRCTGCKGDLFCSTCFESFHDSFELGKHKAIPFVKQDKKDELSPAKMNLIQKLLTSDSSKNT